MKAVLAIEHDLAGGALGEGDHRGSAGERLDHHHPERLRPADRHQERLRAREQLLAAPPPTSPTNTTCGRRRAVDLAAEVLLLSGLHGSGEHEPHAGGSRCRDCTVRALDRVQPTHPQQVVVLVVAKRPVFDTDRVGHDIGDAHAGRRVLELEVADRDESRLVAVPRVERARLVVERAVQGVHDRHRYAARHGHRGETRVVVHEIERPTLRAGAIDRVVGRADVVGLVQRGADLIGMGAFQRGADPGGRARAGRGEQRDVVSPRDQLVAQQRDDGLDPSVAGGGTGIHGGASTAILSALRSARGRVVMWCRGARPWFEGSRRRSELSAGRRVLELHGQINLLPSRGHPHTTAGRAGNYGTGRTALGLRSAVGDESGVAVSQEEKRGRAATGGECATARRGRRAGAPAGGAQPARRAVRGPRPRRPGRAAGRAGDSGRGARGVARDQGRRAVPVRAHGRRRGRAAGVRRGLLRPRHALSVGDPLRGRRRSPGRALLCGGRRPRDRRLDERQPAARGAGARAAAVVEHQPRADDRLGPAVLPRARAQLPARGGHDERLARSGRRLRRHLRGAWRAAQGGARACARSQAAGARAGAGLCRRGRDVPRGGHRARPAARAGRAGPALCAGTLGGDAGAGGAGDDA